MKVLVIYHSGLSREALGFYDEYILQGVELDVIVPSKVAIEKTYSASGFLTYSDAPKNQPYHIIPVDLRKPHSYGEGFNFFQLYKAIKHSKPDIIHVFDEFTSFYLAQVLLCRNSMYGRKVPVLCYASQNIAFKNPPFVWKVSPRFFKRLAYKILFVIMLAFSKKYLDGATGCNTEALDIIKNLGAKFPVKRTFWGINFEMFHPQEKNLCREKFNIPKDKKIVGYVGRLDKEKGVDTLIKAVSSMKDYCLMMPESGTEKPALDMLIKELGMQKRVYYYASVKRGDLPKLYNCSDVLVVPSKTTPLWKEQYGRVLVEAMGCHVSIVGSSSGAIPEVLDGYPRHLIFEENSVEDLIDKIKNVESLTFPADFDANYYLQRFSVKTFIESYVHFYTLILKHGTT